jgi:hypothetical protein
VKKLLEELAEWIPVVLILALVFLFYGSPDVWDRLHDRAMGVTPQCPPTPSAGGSERG